jgi:hypothetical protein
MSGAANSSQFTGIGPVPRAVQQAFEKEEKKINEFEVTNKKFYNDVRNYADKIDKLAKSENKMMQNLSNLASNNSLNSSRASATESTSNYSPSSDNNNNNSADSSSSSSSTSSSSSCSTHREVDQNEKIFLDKLKTWKEFNYEHNQSSEKLKQTCQSHVVEQMKNLNQLFPQVKRAIRERESARKLLTRLQKQLDELQQKERTGKNLVKETELNQQVKQATQHFNEENDFLMKQLPNLYDSRLDYIKPCVSSLINAQLNFYDEYSTFYEKILQKNEPNLIEMSPPPSSNNSENVNNSSLEQKTILGSYVVLEHPFCTAEGS